MKKLLRAIFHRQAETPSAQALKRALNPPHDDTQDVLHGTVVKDPFRPLEQLDAPETLAWAARQDQRADDFIVQAQDVRDAAQAFFDTAAVKSRTETMPVRKGDLYFVDRQEPEAARPSFCVKEVPDYDAPVRVLLDPATIDPSGKTRIAFHAVTNDGKTLAYALSVSGSDKATLKFMDIATGKDIDATYTNFPTNVNPTITWDDDGQGFHYLQSDEKTKSSDVRHHKMGTGIEEDTLVFAAGAPETGGHYARVGEHEYISTYVAIKLDESDKNGLLVRRKGSDEPFREIFPMKEGLLRPIHEVGGKLYALTNYKAPNARLVAIDLSAPAPENWQDILPENTTDPLKDVYVWHDQLYAKYTHDTGETLKVFDEAGTPLHDVPIPPLSIFDLGQLRADDTRCLVTLQNFQQAATVYEYDSATNEMSLHKDSIVPIHMRDCIVERVYATSKDGTKVPMTVIRAPETKLDGTAATILYGYGGFNVPLEPMFSPGIAQWVRAGGVYAYANLRGGGEFGQTWYDQGRLANKQNVFDDAAACAEYLVAQNYTCAKRLALQGGSNGGLLATATCVQYPALFGAVVAEVPVTDMFRFHLGSYEGFSWKSDYGDPDKKEDFEVAAKYSPLHNVKEGFKHPPLLIKTDAHDDRVLPWHSYKMAATLQTKEDPDSLTLLKVRRDGGHAGGMTLAQRYADIALVRAFLARTLGPINQNDYKAALAQKQKSGRTPPAP